jgi:DNA-binding FadR family transcriptional regulator
MVVDHLLYAQVISDINDKINQRILLPNQKLPSERQLSAQYKVSRTVVREAIKVLSEKGLVEVKVGKGTYITKPTNGNVTGALRRVIHSGDSTIEDIIEVREELELAIMKKAVLHATSAGLEALKRVYQRMDRPNIKVDDFVALDAKFHLSIAHLTH